MYNITIDARMVQASGVGTYISNLLPQIITSLDSCKFHILGPFNILREYNWSNHQNATIIDFDEKIYTISEQYKIIKKIPKGTSLFWSPHYNYPLFYSGKLLVTVHDVFHLAMPQFVGGIHKRLYANFMFNTLVRRANQIISVSEFSKQEIIRFTGCNESKIETIYNGVDNSWFRVEKKECPHPKPYLLYVGNVKPHKNLVSLLKAFEIIKDRVPHDIVIVGKKDGFLTGDQLVLQAAAELGNRIMFTGEFKNNDDALKQYYAHASALVLPSYYESFGLPPLEAMSCGCPAIVSNVAALPEVYQDCVLYIDPHSVDNIAETIMKLLSSEDLANELRAKGYERAKHFAWQKSAEKTIAVINEVLKK